MAKEEEVKPVDKGKGKVDDTKPNGDDGSAEYDKIVEGKKKDDTPASGTCTRGIVTLRSFD